MTDSRRIIYPTKRYRNAVFTLNNYTDDEVNQLREHKCSYLVFGFEIAPTTGTPHLQGYVEWQNAKQGSTIFKINPRIHWQKRIGTSTQAADYCKKEPGYFEKGECTKQGQRTDLDEIVESIRTNNTTATEILEQNPMAMHMYGRTIDRFEDLMMSKKYRTEMTEGIWYWGDTGVGKSHKAFENFTPDTHYVYPDDNGWWDYYRQQDTVIINEFRGSIPYKQLLELVDKWPLMVKRRNRGPIPFTSKLVIITSSMPPQMVYHNLSQTDSMAQLFRRFKVIELTNE